MTLIWKYKNKCHFRTNIKWKLKFKRSISDDFYHFTIKNKLLLKLFIVYAHLNINNTKYQ